MIVACFRCGAFIDDDQEDIRNHDNCIYVACDDLDCRALRHPPYAVEAWREVALHYQMHHYLGGCSHAR